MASYLESMDSDLLLTIANDIRKRYNKIRHEFYESARLYYRQSLYSIYCKEEDMITLLEECHKLKMQYRDVADILRARKRRVPLDIETPDSNEFLFRTL